jgi:hypothetical protein
MLGVIQFLVHWFVLDLEVLGCFRAPVVIWSRTAYCSSEASSGGLRGGWCSWLVVIGDCFVVVVVEDIF